MLCSQPFSWAANSIILLSNSSHFTFMYQFLYYVSGEIWGRAWPHSQLCSEYSRKFYLLKCIFSAGQVHVVILAGTSCNINLSLLSLNLITLILLLLQPLFFFASSCWDLSPCQQSKVRRYLDLVKILIVLLKCYCIIFALYIYSVCQTVL